MTKDWTEVMEARAAEARAETEELRAREKDLLAELAALRQRKRRHQLTLIRTVDPETGWTLWRNPNLRGVPDTVLEADGLRVELIGGEILCIEWEGKR